MAIRYTKGENSGFTPLPVGTYNFRVLEQEQTVSKAGNPQLKVRVQVLDGPHAGRELNQWYSFSPKAIWALEALFDAVGLEATDTGEVGEDGMPIMEIDESELTGLAFAGFVTQEEWPVSSGQFNNRITKPVAADDYPNWDEAADAASAPEPAPEPKETAPHPSSTSRRRRRVSA